MRRDAFGDYNHQTTKRDLTARTARPRKYTVQLPSCQAVEAAAELVLQLGRVGLQLRRSLRTVSAAGRVVASRPQIVAIDSSQRVAIVSTAPAHAPGPLSWAQAGKFGSSGDEAGGWLACVNGA